MKEAFALEGDPCSTRIRALVVEDSHISIRAISNLISLQPGVRVVGNALDGEDGLRLARTLKPDIVFVDFEMPGKSGIEVVEILRREMPSIRLVVISVHEGSVWAGLCRTHGADAFVSKSDLAEKLPAIFREYFSLPSDLMTEAAPKPRRRAVSRV